MDRETFCKNYGVTRKKLYLLMSHGDGTFFELSGHGKFKVQKMGNSKTAPLDILPINGNEVPKQIPVSTDLNTLTRDELDKKKRVEEILKLREQREEYRERVKAEVMAQIIPAMEKTLHNFSKKLASLKLEASRIDELKKAIEESIEELDQ